MISFVEKSKDYQLIIVMHPRLYKKFKLPRVASKL